jgi:hypothetical protein
MTDTLIQFSEDEFSARYKLKVNHLNPTASWACGEGPGCLFEPYGEELAFARSQDPRAVWTLIDGDDGDQRVVSGMHFVNRIGYLISTEPVSAATTVEVCIPMELDDGREVAENEAHAGLLAAAARHCTSTHWPESDD